MRIVHSLLCINPAERMGVDETVRMLQLWGTSCATNASEADISAFLSALLGGGAECESAVIEVRAIVDGLKSRGDWDGMYGVLWQLRVDSGVNHPDDFVELARQLLHDIRGVITGHVISDAAEL